MSDHDPIPGSVFNARQVRTLKIVVIVMTILLVLGFALLIAGLYYQATKIGEDGEERRGQPARAQSAGGDVTLPVPAGARIERVHAEGGRVVLHVKGAGAEQILVIDTTRDNAVTRIRLSPR